MGNDHAQENGERLEAIKALADTQQQYMRVRQERATLARIGYWFTHRADENHYSDLARQIREGRP